MHGHGGLESQLDWYVTIRRVGLTMEEGCVTVDLDQVEALGGVDHLLKQFHGVDLGAREAHQCVRM